MTILFVDDNPEFLKSITEICRTVRPERTIVSFVDALEAMNYINRNHKAIRGVITDFKMTSYGMSGNIIVEKCQEKSVPVYICTGYGDQTPWYKSEVQIIDKCAIHTLIKTLEEI